MELNKSAVRKRVSEIRSAAKELREIASKPFEELSTSELYAMRYLVIVIAEAIAALCLHVARGKFGLEPSSGRECLKRLLEKKVVSEKVYSDVSKILSLRNLLVHRYWVIDDRRVYESVKSNFSSVEEPVSYTHLTLPTTERV